MKLLTIICETALENQITKLLDDRNINYSKFHNIVGKGRTGRKENNPIWPGINMIFYIGISEEKVSEIVLEIEKIRNSYTKTPGCKIFSLSAEDIL